MVSFATLVAMLFLAVLGGLVFNTGNTVKNKLQTQNAADAASYSSSVWQARGMNAVTAANHMMGELQALYIIHHSFGGKWLDEKSPNERNENDNEPIPDSRNWTMPELRDAVKFWYNGEGSANGDIFPKSFIEDFVDDHLPSIPFLLKKPFGKAFGKIFDFVVGKVFGMFPLNNAEPFPAIEAAHKTVIRDPSADRWSTIFEAKAKLRDEMIEAYKLHRKGWLLYWIGDKLTKTGILAIIGLPLQAIGAIMEGIALAKEIIIWKEYIVLDVVEGIAHGVKGAKKQIPTVLGAISKYQDSMTFMGASIKASARKVADVHGAQGEVVFDELPVERENAPIERSQLMRATYPWVVRWRSTIIREVFRKPIPFLPLPDVPGVTDLFGLLPFSKADDYYVKWTNIYSYEACRWISSQGNYDRFDMYGMEQSGRGLKLMVVKGLKSAGGFHKSMEPWAYEKGRVVADDIFTLFGCATTKPPVVEPAVVFRQENPNGIVCFAQSMIYNANHQQPPGESSLRPVRSSTRRKDKHAQDGWKTKSRNEHQPVVGWDTLNWIENDILEWRMERTYEDAETRFDDPKIQLNWQAKLTPVTRHKLGKVTRTLHLDLSVNTRLVLLRSVFVDRLNNH
jgi:hypothetical protein